MNFETTTSRLDYTLPEFFVLCGAAVLFAGGALSAWKALHPEERIAVDLHWGGLGGGGSGWRASQALAALAAAFFCWMTSAALAVFVLSQHRDAEREARTDLLERAKLEYTAQESSAVRVFQLQMASAKPAASVTPPSAAGAPPASARPGEKPPAAPAPAASLSASAAKPAAPATSGK